MSEMTREQGYAHCIQLLSSGDPAYKPRVLARQFIGHFDQRRPSAEEVSALAREWIAAISTRPTPPASNPGAVRCTDCKHCPERPGGRCAETGKYGMGHAHWRRCELYAWLGEDAAPPPAKPTFTEQQARLKAEGLAPLVEEHRALDNGHRLIRFKPGTTAEQRFSVYAALGLARDSKPLSTKRSQPATQTNPAPSANSVPSAA